MQQSPQPPAAVARSGPAARSAAGAYGRSGGAGAVASPGSNDFGEFLDTPLAPR
jgi:hypothetical protein